MIFPKYFPAVFIYRPLSEPILFLVDGERSSAGGLAPALPEWPS